MTDEIFGRKAPQGEGDAARMQLIGGELFRESDFERDGKGNIKTDAEGRPIVKQSVLREIEQERNTIWDDAEKRGLIKKDKDGYYAVAPNGKRSNLTPHQWVETRTKRFKEWFGDWETNAEVSNMQKRLVDWLSPVNLQAAQGLTREQIYQKFGNDLQEIAFVPAQYIQALDTKIVDNRIYCGMGYMIDHAVNHHPNVPAADYSKIQDVLDNPDAVKDVSSGNGANRSVAFIKNIGRYHTVIIELSTDGNGKIILHKTYFNQKKMPYAGKPDIQHNPSMGATPSYIHTGNSAYGSKLSALGGTTKVGNKFLIPNNSSKIVDENGEPLVVYHGTPMTRQQWKNTTPHQVNPTWTINSVNAPFKTFKGGEYGGLIFATADEIHAKAVADRRSMHIPDGENGEERWSEEGYVFRLWADGRKPFRAKDTAAASEILDAMGDNITEFDYFLGGTHKITRAEAESILNGGNSWLVVETPEFQAEVKKRGYDSIIASDQGTEYVAVYDPKQLKSADTFFGHDTNPVGTFSRETGDIRFSLREKPAKGNGENLQAMTKSEREGVKTSAARISASAREIAEEIGGRVVEHSRRHWTTPTGLVQCARASFFSIEDRRGY